jgi:phage shock protein A
MQTNIHGVAALAQLNSERLRAEELERCCAAVTERASTLQSALDAATEMHGHEALRTQAAHAEQVQRLEGALEHSKGEVEELRKGVAALEAGPRIVGARTETS